MATTGKSYHIHTNKSSTGKLANGKKPDFHLLVKVEVNWHFSA